MKTIHICQLISPCVTRARGEEAGKMLQSYIGTEQMELDFDGVDMVSLSFLDGLISYVLVHASSNDIVFRVNDQSLKDKLARIVAMRGATVYWYENGRQTGKVPAKYPNEQGTVFAPSKATLRH